jgi:hypothetical protein
MGNTKKANGWLYLKQIVTEFGEGYNFSDGQGVQAVFDSNV